MRKKAIIIGASSGIGMDLARVLSENGYEVGLAARRVEILTELQSQLPAPSYIKKIDVTQPAEAMTALSALICEMGGADVVVISSGISIHNPPLEWQGESDTIDVNVVGFAAMANVAFRYFCEQGRGHIVGISSFRGLRGGWSSPAYNASKAFVSNYLEGLRVKSRKLGKDIAVTDVRLGLVHTPMTKREESPFVAPVRKATQQIFGAMQHQRKVSYVTKRYNLIAPVLSNMPFWLYSRI